MNECKKVVKEPLKIDWLKECEKVNTETFSKALDLAIKKVGANLSKFTEKFPSSGGVNGEYVETENGDTLLSSDWTSSFWTGMVWLAYDVTGEERFKETGFAHSKSFLERYEKNVILDHHDIGFLYSLSCVAAYKLTEDEASKKTALLAAEKLMKQYMEKCGCLQQWGSPTDHTNEKLGIGIIDGCMNLPLLYWAAQITGNRDFYEKALAHITTAGKYMIRENGAAHQNIKFDVDTGKLLDVYTSQGDGRENACWSRGQAWAIYGFALSYKYTGKKEFLDLAKACANYFLNHLQSDYCANWDFIYDKDTDQRDTSAVSTAICGLLELALHLPLTDPDQKIYNSAAKVLMSALIKNYAYTEEESHTALLKAGVYAYKSNLCVNEPVIWGDYFYMEALVRLLCVHQIFW